MILINNLKKSYGDFSLSIPELQLQSGLIYGLVGKNGAGKTTLIQCLLGLINYDGDIRYDGKPFAEYRIELLAKIAYVSDTLFYNHEMTGLEVQRFTKRYYPNWDDQLFLLLSQSFGISLKKKLKQLSQGTKIKLAVALAIAKQPEFFILDEPTSGLDPIIRLEVLKELKKLSKERKIVILFSTHILEDVIEIVDKVVTINNGRINNVFDKAAYEPQILISQILHSIGGLDIE